MNQEDLHYKLALGLNQTYIEKNADYGDAFNKSLDSHGLTAAIVRMEDKMGRFSNLAGRPDSMQVEESLEDTLLDLANYAIMTVMWLKQQPVNMYADNKAYMNMDQFQKETNAKADLVVENFNKKMEPKGTDDLLLDKTAEVISFYDHMNKDWNVILGSFKWKTTSYDKALAMVNLLVNFTNGVYDQSQLIETFGIQIIGK